jgi:hypothetical protein
MSKLVRKSRAARRISATGRIATGPATAADRLRRRAPHRPDGYAARLARNLRRGRCPSTASAYRVRVPPGPGRSIAAWIWVALAPWSAALEQSDASGLSLQGVDRLGFRLLPRAPAWRRVSHARPADPEQQAVRAGVGGFGAVDRSRRAQSRLTLSWRLPLGGSATRTRWRSSRCTKPSTESTGSSSSRLGPTPVSA